MTVLPESARRVLDSNLLAHVTTLDADGAPHVTCAWVGLDGDEIVFGTLADQRKLANLRRDPRITLSIHTADTNAYGLTEYLVVYGRARVTEGGAPELLQELARTYIGEGVKFPAMDDPPPGFVTHIAVERVAGVGPWARGS
jgi:PPOX class probable F420-dependent enzyme